MGLNTLCFWGSLWVLGELCMVQYAILQLSLLLALLGVLITWLWFAELDLVAYVLAATYASVFLALAFLLLHFGLFWGAAVWQPRGRLTQRYGILGGVLCVLLGLGLVGGLCGPRVPVMGGPVSCGSLVGLGSA
jgi:hypothetical protein